ncbi:hypothetical protein A3B32_01955 [Candidatus Uhrbacteria bacterium RIFCSPLOWO2_01_FULL_53_9]|nr:MAG: hypothetical protein A3B32_01955 [Candidatus Uhrbacteria bacterium RIFCSPLOWO2_01_FULL_53_9]
MIMITIRQQSFALVLALTTMMAAAPTVFGASVNAFTDLRVASSQSVPTHATSVLRQAGTVQRVGNATIVYEAPIDMATTAVYVYRDGKEARVDGVPVSALRAATILRNQNRIVWAEASGSPARFDIYELDLAQGVRVRRFDDIFLGNASQVIVRVDGATFYFEVQHTQTLRNGFPQVEILRATSSNGATVTVNNMWRNQFEVIEDIQRGRVLTRVVFENGDQELWLHENNVPSRAIPDSYTINGYLLGARIVGNTVEFFRYQKLMLYEIASGRTTMLDDRLLWEKNILDQESRLMAHNGTLFYISYNEKDGRHYIMRRRSGVTSNIGTWDGTAFVQNGTLVSFTHADQFVDGYDTYDMETGLRVLQDGGIQWTDAYGSARVVVDRQGRVVWSQGLARRVIGYAPLGRAYVVDATHVMIPMLGRNGHQYVTVRPQAWLRSEGDVFAKRAGSPSVYLFRNGKRYTVANEDVYYSWEPNFARIIDLSLMNVNAYVDGGFAPYAPGTMIKSPEASTVHMVVDDTHKSPIVNEAAAFRYYGPFWWHDVHVVSKAQLDRYQVVTNMAE